MQKIKNLLAREILDSRGNPTVEVDFILEDGAFGRAAVPSGASTGAYEAKELRDGGTRYGGKGVLKAVENVNGEIRQTLFDKEFDQESLDERLVALDGTPNKSRLGANAILGVSLAFARAMAVSEKKPLYEYFSDLASTLRTGALNTRWGKRDTMCLPVPQMNILNGGRHAERSTDIQEWMIMPVAAKNFREALRCGAEVYHCLKKIVGVKGLPTTVGDEGGFTLPNAKNEDAIKLLLEAVMAAGYEPGKDVALAIDVAASEFCKNGAYEFACEKRTCTSGEMIALYREWTEKYPFVSIEDGLAEDDWEGWSALTAALGAPLKSNPSRLRTSHGVQIVGDDLFATNLARLKTGIEKKAANAILVKLNQIGTVTETIRVVKMGQEAGYGVIVSHRSGETEDTAIADFAVGLGVGQIKTGAPSRGERTAKYNRLLRIEEELGVKARYAGREIFIF